MNFEPTKQIRVYYQPFQQKILVGKLVLNDRRIFFEYDADFLTQNLSLSPFKLPLQPGIIQADTAKFEGLFGVFNDSLPDGWGRVLLDRKLMMHNINPLTLSPLDRLCFVGKHGMGALRYEPEIESEPHPLEFDLETIADEVRQFQEDDAEQYVENLLQLGSSSAGARPKVLLTIDNEHWIIKFKSAIDQNDVGAIEYAYHLMAKAAGLDVPAAKLFPAKKGHGFFGVKRFDKIDAQNVHMHTVSGLLHADHRIPSLDYQSILRATMHLTQNFQECEKQFRHCVFNVFAHNRDDHSKNFSFLMDEEGTWSVSPAYDLTFSSGPNGEHCTMLMGEGKNPAVEQLLKLATISDIKKQRALEIIDEIKTVVSHWNRFAEEAEVSATSKRLIQATLNKQA
jgi:serine/threonine-protein kinase HipA